MSILKKNVRLWERRKGLRQRRSKASREGVDSIQRLLTKPAIRCLSTIGGVKRIISLMYEETRSVLKTFFENVLRVAVTYMEPTRRNIVISMDVVYALKIGKDSLRFGVKVTLFMTCSMLVQKSWNS